MPDIEELKAIERLRAKYRKELEANPTFLAYEALGKTLNQLRNQLAHAGSDSPLRQKVKRVRLRRAGTSASQADLVAKLLEEAEKPLSAARLVEKLGTAGRPVGGEKKTINLSSVLSKDGRFVSHQWPTKGSYVWWFKDRPLPEASADDTMDALPEEMDEASKNSGQ